MDARLQSVRVLPGSRRSWWPKHERKNCEPQKLKPGGDLLVRQETKERPEPVDAEQRDVPDSDPRKPDSDATKRVRISTKRSDPGELAEEAHKKLRAHCDETVASALDDDGNRVRTVRETGKSSRDSCCGGSRAFALMLESGENLETHTERNAVALDLHEPDPETMWCGDLGWVPKSILQEAREKKVAKLQGFHTFEEVPQVEAEGHDIISSRFVDKFEETGELRSHLCSRGYEASQVDPQPHRRLQQQELR